MLVVGRGSNLLVADEGFPGIAVRRDRPRWRLDDARTPAGPAEARGGSGLALPVVARRLAAAGWRGFEWAVGVPGSLGGAVRMNAGGHGSDMASCLVAAHIFDLAGWSSGVAIRRRARLAIPGLRSHRPRRRGRGAIACPRRRPRRRRGGDRRDRAVATREPAGWPERRVGVRQSRTRARSVPGCSSTGSGCAGCGSARHGCRRSTPTSSRPSDGGSAHDVRAVIELVRARVAEATGIELRSEVRLVGFEDEQ